jgi:hypothetical protein
MDYKFLRRPQLILQRNKLERLPISSNSQNWIHFLHYNTISKMLAAITDKDDLILDRTNPGPSFQL